MKLIIITLALFFSGNVFAHEHLRGFVKTVVEENAEQEIRPLPFATVHFAETAFGATTDEEGFFDLHKPNTDDTLILVVSYTGFVPDSIPIPPGKTEIEVVLATGVEIDEVMISRRLGMSYVSRLEPAHAEVITVSGLQVLACCNLGESFESSASVDVGYSDAVSGAQRIEMLGLDGIYSQIMFENIPNIRGLSSTYGFSYIPGPWMESIHISKGASSVLHGYESITGLINVDYKKPQDSEPLFVNAYFNNEGRYEGNLTSAIELSEKWSTMILSHLSTQQKKIDHNENTFLDIPLGTQLNLINRWNYEVEHKSHIQFGIHLLSEDRRGGQTDFDRERDYGTENSYGIGIETRKIQGFFKGGFAIPGSGHSSIATLATATYYDQSSFFGLNGYDGIQKSFNASALYNTQTGDHGHGISTGISYMWDDYSEHFNQTPYERVESVPGIFGEYTFNYEDEFSLVTGLRADHNSVYGWFVTPRMHLRYELNEDNILRGSLGRGFRTANIFAEHSPIMASSRELIISEELDAEEAWNYGVNFTRVMNLNNAREAVFNIDFYRTEFRNQIIADLDQNVREVVFYNLDGQSYSNSFQTDFTVEVLEGLEFYLAYRFNDVKATINGQLREIPFVNRHKGVVTATYETPFENWRFHIANQFNGPGRLPDSGGNPGRYSWDNYSPSHFLMQGQATRRFSNFEIYLGSENITNFMQPNPVIANDEPFGSHFDASIIWGPFTGRKVYGGLRYTFDQ